MTRRVRRVAPSPRLAVFRTTSPPFASDHLCNLPQLFSSFRFDECRRIGVSRKMSTKLWHPYRLTKEAYRTTQIECITMQGATPALRLPNLLEHTFNWSL